MKRKRFRLQPVDKWIYFSSGVHRCKLLIEMNKGHWTVLNSCREERFRGKRGHRGWNGWGKTNGSGAAPPHTSRFPAAQRLQECLGARLSRESCSYSCILFLQAAPDNTCLFIALGSFSAWLSKGRPCLQVTKVSCKPPKQKARPNTEHSGQQVEPKTDLFTFGKEIYQLTKG